MSSENSAIPVCPEQQILRTSQGNYLSAPAVRAKP